MRSRADQRAARPEAGSRLAFNYPRPDRRHAGIDLPLGGCSRHRTARHARVEIGTAVVGGDEAYAILISRWSDPLRRVECARGPVPRKPLSFSSGLPNGRRSNGFLGRP